MKKSKRRPKLPLKFKDHVMENQSKRRDGNGKVDQKEIFVNPPTHPVQTSSPTGTTNQVDIDSLHSTMSKLNNDAGIQNVIMPPSSIDGGTPTVRARNQDQTTEGDQIRVSSLAGCVSSVDKVSDGDRVSSSLRVSCVPDSGISEVGIDVSLTSVEGVANFFGVPLITKVDYDNFAKAIEKGTVEVWSKLTRVQRKEILKIARDGWNALHDLESAGLDALVNTVPSVVSPSQVEVDDPVFDGVNISIPRRVVQKVSSRLEHTLYGYFIGQRLAFPVVEYFAKSNWGKHGLKRVMMNNEGFFFFKFESREGLDDVLEGGPWMIRRTPIILKKWSMGTCLHKEELTRIPVWVKLHDVPIQVFEEEGINLIANFLGTPIMFDSYTKSMCQESWGRSSFARCLIEVNSLADLVDVVTIGVPSLDSDDFTKVTIRVEYEWKPPRCATCNIFGHSIDQCPKKVVSPSIATTSNAVNHYVETSNDGFQTVTKKKKRGKSKATNSSQVASQLGKQSVRFEPKAPKSALMKVNTTAGPTVTQVRNPSKNLNKEKFTSPNPYSVLNNDDEEEEEVENVYDETANLFSAG